MLIGLTPELKNRFIFQGRENFNEASYRASRSKVEKDLSACGQGVTSLVKDV